MSLKNFHLVFIALAIALALFCAGWSLQSVATSASVSSAIAAALSFAGAVLLIWYERRFVRKCRERQL